MAPTLLGIDVGGTFTDFVLLKDGELTIHKVLTTPQNPAQAVLQGVRHLVGGNPCQVVHGSTVATNAILERKGAKTALITTKGFADVLEIGRQTRPALYDLLADRPPPLVPASLCFEADERIDWTGAVIRPLDPDSVERILRLLTEQGITSVAVCLLFSFLNPIHEQAIKGALSRHTDTAPFFISLSAEVLPEYREYERTSTTVVNAYVSPLVDSYVSSLEQALAHPTRMMQSSGGSISGAAAKRWGVHTVLSGPAGGVMGAFYVAQGVGLDHIITFDMGGTSTDVCLCPGTVPRTHAGEIAGFPVRIPMIDIHSVGAGGGSIAQLDADGALRVGPESAGSQPGPVCYGRGDRVTVTDANLVLGRLDAHHFLGGRMTLEEFRTQEALAALGRQMGCDGVTAAERGRRVANANMENAIRRVSVRRGFDPRRFTLVAFGGAGPLHACELAQELGIPTVLIPMHPGVLSALGMLATDLVKDYGHTVMLPTNHITPQRLVSLFAPLQARGEAEMAAEGMGAERLRWERALDMRYVGQSYEITVPLHEEDLSQPTCLETALVRFHALHQQYFGHSHPSEPTEVVTVRLRAIGPVSKPPLTAQEMAGPEADAALVGEKPVYFNGFRHTRLYERALLQAGNQVAGPAIVFQFDSTIVIPPSWLAQVDSRGNLVLRQKNR